jgi:hypothetical protein
MPYSTEKSAKLTCKCYYCVNDAWVGIDANGTTCLATLATDTNVVVQFNVLNIYEEASLVNLQLASTQGWAVDPPLPSSLLLGPGECAEFFVNVAVPGGLADGTNNIITLTGEIEGAPESASASAIIMVSDACIPTLTEWGLIIFGLVLLGFVTWAFLKRRKVVDVGA